MKLAWTQSIPTATVAPKNTGYATRPETATQTGMAAPAMPSNTSEIIPTVNKPAMGNVLGTFVQKVREFFAPSSAPQAGTLNRQGFLLPEQMRLKEQISTYAESPVDEALFSIRKKPGMVEVSLAWADAIRSKDALTRESAVNLLKAYLSYTGVDISTELSAHTQMKLLLFTPHLTEGPMGKAILYEALLSLPAAQMLEFATALRKDFASLSPMAQAVILKQMFAYWKKRDTSLGEEESETLQKLIKGLVIQFYTNGNKEALDQLMNQHEKVRLGHLKIQPIEEDYRKHLEEIERRYRQKLRQLKKTRSQKIAEADEEKLHRIELIYESIEEQLSDGLGSMDLSVEQMLASV